MAKSLVRFLFLMVLTSGVNASLLGRLPFLGKKKYTPLLFFKVPTGVNPQCSAMEKCVKEVEKELGVRVERLDVANQLEAKALVNLISGRKPPLLYNRESKQIVYLPEDAETPDIHRVRAWAMGRRVKPYTATTQRGDVVPEGVLLDGEDNAIDQEDLVDPKMAELQRASEEAIRELTKGQRRMAGQ